jgi:hypothetical protein
MDRVRVSIALCTCNGERYLRQQLHSIAQQTRLPYELVVCDDVSTDSTRRIVEEFARSASFPVRFFRNAARLGSTKNYEQAIGLCAGDLIALCDQDDIWLPEKLAHQVDLIEREPMLGGVFSDAQLIDDRSIKIGKQLWASISFSPRKQKQFCNGKSADVLLRGNVVTGPTLMFRADLRPLLMPIPESWYEDAWIALMLALHSRLAPIPTSLIQYRIHPDQQVGVESLGPSARLPMLERFEKAGREIPGKCMCLIRELEDLKRHLAEADNSNPQVIAAIQEQIAFLKARAKPRRNRLTKATCILRNAAGYRRYEAGWRPLLRDIAICFCSSAADCNQCSIERAASGLSR